MKKVLVTLLSIFLLGSCKPTANLLTNQKNINTTLDNWHRAAAVADFETYFSLMTPNGVFIGTDPTENWQNQDFRSFSKPFFDRGKAWNFTPLERHIYFSDDAQTAWFDELLDTQMKLCRGSGTLVKRNNQWRIAHYVLSIAIPNDSTTEIVKLKTAFDDKIIQKLQLKK